MHLNALYSPNQKKKTILETVLYTAISTRDGGFLFDGHEDSQVNPNSA